jgi:ABC-type antimicrobial peptide transport system permease subunit
MILVSTGATTEPFGGLAAAQLVKRVLFSVDPTDWKAVVVAIVVLAIIAIVACLIPARRAAEVDPVVALRSVNSTLLVV